jgi:hypothetical protein
MKILRLFTIILILMNSTMLLGQGAGYEMKLNDVRALAGELIEVELEITNEGEFYAIGLDIPLPTGFSFVDDSFQLSDRSSGHVSSAVVVSGNILRILVFHQEETTAFLGEEGVIATFHLQTPEAPGIYPLEIVDGVLSDADAMSLPLVTVPGTVTLVGNEIRILNTEVIINQDVTIDIEIENYQSFTAFQASIVLPEGFTYVEESAVLNTERAVENDHILQVNLAGDVLTIYSYSMTNTLFEGNGGIVVSFVLNAAPALGDGTPRDFPLVFQEAIISNTDGEDILTASHDGIVTVYDHNIISVLDAAALTNEIITIDIDIDNSLPFTAFEIDIVLPEGFEYQEGSVVLNPERAGDHEFTVSLQDDILHIVVYSLTSELFSGWEGIVASFDVKLPNDPGVYPLVIDQAIISSADATDILTGTVDGVVTVDVEIILSLLDTEVCSDVPVMVDINLANSQTVTAFETEVLIPEGFEYVAGSAVVADRADDHQISESYNADTGVLTLVVYSLTSAIFEGTNGVVASFELIAPIVAETTAFDIELHNTIVSNPDAIDILTGTMDASITVFPLAVAEITVDGELAFCDGGFVTLTANESAEYLWSTGETTQSIIVEVSGVYYVTITDENGCIDTSEEIEVTVWPLPVTEIVPDGDTEFCDGGFVVLTAETYEGHEVDIVEYLWSNGAETMSIVVEESGTFSVTVIDANGCTYTSEPIEVVVWALPEAEITTEDDLQVCFGETIELTATLLEGHDTEIVSYLWSNGMTTESITVSEAGTYTFYVIVTDENGCEFTTPEVEVTIWAEVVAEITADGALTFCDGGAVVLTATEAAEYLWSNGATTRSITVTESGSFSVTITDANGCSATSDEVVVTVNALPTVTCPGNMQVRLWGDEAFALTGATPAGGTYSGRGVANGQFNPYTAGVGTHVITYTYTDGNGCTNTCTFEIEVINDTSVPGISEPSIKVYPNPARSILNITVENQQINEIRMIDMLGQIVYTASVQNDRHEINVGEFKSGIYFVQVITSEGMVTQRVQVTR